MVTLTEAVQFAVRKQALVIHDMKTATRVVESYDKYGYVSPDGSSISAKRPSEPEKADWKPGKIKCEKIVSYMSPKSTAWRQYRAAQCQVSLLLTARLILKCGGETVPSINELRAALGQDRISHHCRRGRRNQLAFKAYRYLKKLANRLEHRPEAFSGAQVYLESIVDRKSPERERIEGHDY
jgi:hypothetical protein